MSWSVLIPMRRRTGFTILELLAVLTIIGVLATIAVVKFGDSKRRAYLSAMKSDLHTVATIAESKYTADDSYEHVTAPKGSAGVTLTFAGTRTGWVATAVHSGVPGIVCTLESGPGKPYDIDCR